MSNAFPDTRHAMLRAGYKLVYSRPCSRCQQLTDRWRTRNGKEITLDSSKSDDMPVRMHHATCPAAIRDRERQAEKTDPLYRLARQTRAAAIVVIHGSGQHRFVVDALQCDAADTHNAICAAASAVRDHLVNLNVEQS